MSMSIYVNVNTCQCLYMSMLMFFFHLQSPVDLAFFLVSCHVRCIYSVYGRGAPFPSFSPVLFVVMSGLLKTKCIHVDIYTYVYYIYILIY